MSGALLYPGEALSVNVTVVNVSMETLNVEDSSAQVFLREFLGIPLSLQVYEVHHDPFWLSPGQSASEAGVYTLPIFTLPGRYVAVFTLRLDDGDVVMRSVEFEVGFNGYTFMVYALPPLIFALGFLMVKRKNVRVTALAKEVLGSKYLKENWGAPFIVVFMVLLMGSAGLLASGLEDVANMVAVYAYYSLVIGVVLQLICYLKYGKEGE
jgi:hypothetical protein